MTPPPVFDVRDYGARGDGVTLDTTAINAAIAAAVGAGGGRVVLRSGRFLSFSIRLYSRITLDIAEDGVLEAADPARHPGRYDLPEPNPHDQYQDFGHSHWRNSLIWGEDVEDVAIVGLGLIDGAGLTREGPGAPWSLNTLGDRPISMGPPDSTSAAAFEAEVAAMAGLGNKSVALKNARRVVIRNLSVLKGGHFAFLLTGVDGLVMDGLRIDTDRDGVDLDMVTDARLTNLQVNTPNDDAIVLKASMALGERRPTERVEIADCRVSGYDLGTMLDGTRGRTQQISPDQDRVTGRIKIGTETNGDVRDIHIARCTFERSRGLAIETVDGGVIEDVLAEDLILTEITTAPIFLRLGDRRRGPPGTAAGALRRVIIRNVKATGIDPRYAVLLAGLKGRPVEAVTLSNIDLSFEGGMTVADAPDPVPELPSAYPEPSMFGVTPAFGLYARHVRGLTLHNLNLSTKIADQRPGIVLDDVEGLRCEP